MKQERLPINQGTIIVSDRKRTFWMVSIVLLMYASLIVSSAYEISKGQTLWQVISNLINNPVFFLIVFISLLGLSYRRRFYIDLDNKRYRPTIEIGPVKMGQWVKIKNPEYISVFDKGISGIETLYQINLWFANNRHINIFEVFNEEEAFDMGFEVSEILNIDLLDATAHGNFKWVDKDEWRNQSNDETSKKTTKQIRAKGDE